MAGRSFRVLIGVAAASICAAGGVASGFAAAAPADTTAAHVASDSRVQAPVPVRADSRVQATPPSVRAVPRVGFMQVVAHPDDDLLFMNPDLSGAIRAGDAATTVVLTAAEGHAGQTDGHSVHGYVTERRDGLHAAYAEMAGEADRWKVETVAVGRIKVEVHVLDGRSNVRLAFLSIPDGHDKRQGTNSAEKLQADHASRKCVHNFTPKGSRYAHCYTHKDVVKVLTTLMHRYSPTLVRAQDTVPDGRYTADHTDHVATAKFADEAARAYGSRVVQVNYRDYNIADSPVDLDESAFAAKHRTFELYRVRDYKIKAGSLGYLNWQRHMRYRWPRGHTWLTRAAGGRLQAYAVLSGHLYVWWQKPSGWAGPVRLGNSSLAPAVSVAGGQVFALCGRQLVVARPKLSGGKWKTKWATVGTAAGIPAVTTGKRTVVFARNGAGGVSVKCQAANGSWPAKWKTLTGPSTKVSHRVTVVSGDGDSSEALPRKAKRRIPVGHDVQDGMAVTTNKGAVELFAPTRGAVLQWRQHGKGCSFKYAGQVPGARPASPLNATHDGAGRPTLVFQTAGAGIVQLIESGKRWGGLTPRGKGVFNETGEAPVPTGSANLPPRLPVPTVGVPAIAADSHGTISAVALGADGHLYTSVRTLQTPFTPWRPA